MSSFSLIFLFLICGPFLTQVFVVIVSNPESVETSPASVSFTCGFYSIPVIGISNRDSSLSNKNLHGSFMRTIAWVTAFV